MKKVTKTWRANALNCLRLAGLQAKKGKDIATLPIDVQDELSRHWAFYVDKGMDFGSAALRVIRDIHGDGT